MRRTLQLAGLALLASGACAAGPVPSPPPAAAPGRRAPSPSAHVTEPAALAVIDERNVGRVKQAWTVELGGRGVATALDRRAGRVAAATSGSSVRLYDFGSGRSTGVSASCAEVLRGGLGMDRERLVVVCRDALESYDTRSLKQLPAPELHPSRATAAHVQWPLVAVGHHDGVLRIYDMKTRERLEIPVPGPPIDVKSLALDPAHERLAVAWVQGSIWWWKLSEPDVPHSLVRHPRESDTLAFSADGQLLAEEGNPRTTTLWSFDDTPSEVGTLENGAWLKRIWFTADGRWLLRGGSDGLDLAEVSGPRRIALTSEGQVEDVALDPAGVAASSVDRDGQLRLWLAR